MLHIQKQNCDEWDPPHEFEGVKLPKWPNNAFPEQAQKYIQELSRSSETPIELAAMLFLPTVATASHKKYIVEIKTSYRETVNLWTLSVLPPASRKSSVYGQITTPIRLWEEQNKAALEPIIKTKISKNKTIEEKIKRLRQRAANTNDDASFDELQEKISALERELTSMPTYPQLWTSDITSEHLGTLMAQNDEAMSILSDEGGIFDIIGGLYSNGRANIDLLLQSHSGSPARVDRGSKPPIFLKHAVMSMGITVQPEVVKRVCKNKTFRGRGLLGRFLYVMPTSNIGFRTLEEAPMDDSVNIHYMESITAILNHSYDMTNGSPHQHILKLEPEAYLKWLEYSKMLEIMMGRDLDFLSHITDWAGKLSGQIARIAALLHIYRYAFEKPWEQSISAQDMQGAIKIGHVLTRHALKVFDLIHEEDGIEVAKDILKWIAESNLEQFTQRACGRKFRSYQKHKLLRPGLNILKEGGYLHESKSQPPKGPCSIMFDVNPKYKDMDMGQIGQEGQ